ncbi:hypothetical protein BC941DRAFT_503915 [Chlamydoabsidia padenii]|nr:hypothetical protein BC941DRAFT_503915 [Chlamydoabsidia padenii]
MPTYKRSSYDVFIHKVLLPNLRTILLLLAVVALGCGSWLETNSTTDCGFQSTMTVFEVSIYQNISDKYALTPTSVTFGLWKHCFYYAQNCTCTPITLGYEIDAQQTIFAATNNQTMPSIDSSHSSSYIRLIPLIMALVLSVICFGYSFWANRSATRPLLFWINGALALLAGALVSLAFGNTYQTYRTSIIKACQAVNMQSVRCASMASKLEVILLAVALALLVLATLLFGCVRKSNMTDTFTHEIYIDETVPSYKRQSAFIQSFQRNSKLIKSSSSHLSGSSSASKEPAMYGISNDDSLEAWRDVAILDGQQQQGDNYHHELGTFPLRPPPATAGRRSNEYAYKGNQYDRRSSSNQRVTTRRNSSNISSPATTTANDYKRQRQESSSSRSSHSRQTQQYTQHHYDLSSDSNELLPPTLPFADHHQQQQRRRKSSSSPHQPRPASHASGNTFGANEMLMDDSPQSSTFTLEDQQHHHQQQSHCNRQYSDASLRTPLSYQSDSHDSLCFTPTERNASGVSIPRTSSPTHTDQRRKNRNNTIIL